MLQTVNHCGATMQTANGTASGSILASTSPAAGGPRRRSTSGPNDGRCCVVDVDRAESPDEAIVRDDETGEGKTKQGGPDQLPTSDLKALKFFYNLGMDYFRLCVTLPPPNLAAASPPEQTYMNVSPTAPDGRIQGISPQASPLRWQPSQPVANADALFYARTGCPQTDGVVKKASKSSTLDDENRMTTTSGRNRSRSVDVNNEDPEHSAGRGEERATDVDGTGPEVADKYKSNFTSSGSVSDVDEIVSWTPTTAGSQDSGWHSASSSPTSARSPVSLPSAAGGNVDEPEEEHADDGARDCDRSATVEDDAGKLPEQSSGDTSSSSSSTAEDAAVDEHQKTADCAPPLPTGGATETGHHVPPGVHVPRYARPMKDIPVRFRRLLEAEVDRVTKLCRRLQGAPIFGNVLQSDPAAPHGCRPDAAAADPLVFEDDGRSPNGFCANVASSAAAMMVAVDRAYVDQGCPVYQQAVLDHGMVATGPVSLVGTWTGGEYAAAVDAAQRERRNHPAIPAPYPADSQSSSISVGIAGSSSCACFQSGCPVSPPTVGYVVGPQVDSCYQAAAMASTTTEVVPSYRCLGRVPVDAGCSVQQMAPSAGGCCYYYAPYVQATPNYCGMMQSPVYQMPVQ